MLLAIGQHLREHVPCPQRQLGLHRRHWVDRFPRDLGHRHLREADCRPCRPRRSPPSRPRSPRAGPSGPPGAAGRGRRLRVEPPQAAVDRLAHVLGAAVRGRLPAMRSPGSGFAPMSPMPDRLWWPARRAHGGRPQRSPDQLLVVKGPYRVGGVDQRLPRSSAWWITAIDVASSRGVCMSYDAVIPMQPRPITPTAGPLLPSVVARTLGLIPPSGSIPRTAINQPAIEFRHGALRAQMPPLLGPYSAPVRGSRATVRAREGS